MCRVLHFICLVFFSFESFFYCLYFLFCSCYNLLMIVDVLVGVFMLEGDWIFFGVFVVRDDSGRLGFRGLLMKIRLGQFFRVIEGKYCKMDDLSSISLSCLVETRSSIELLDFSFLILFCELVKVLSGFFGWVEWWSFDLPWRCHYYRPLWYLEFPLGKLIILVSLGVNVWLFLVLSLEGWSSILVSALVVVFAIVGGWVRGYWLILFGMWWFSWVVSWSVCLVRVLCISLNHV